MAPTSPRFPTARDCAQAMLEAGASLDFSPPSPSETSAARSMAAGLMGQEVAQVPIIRAVLKLQPASSLVCRRDGEVTGMVATLLLRAEAEADLAAGRFDGLAPPDRLLGRDDEPIGLYYIWGVAGATRRARLDAMALTRKLRREALAGLTAYTFAATPIGRHAAISQVGFRPVRHPLDDLLVSDPVSRRWAA